MSTFLMFIPERISNLLVILCCVGFFGIFLPWQERKKKKKTTKSPSSAPVRPQSSPDRSKLEQLDALKDAGILSQEEYEQKRRELFGKP